MSVTRVNHILDNFVYDKIDINQMMVTYCSATIMLLYNISSSTGTLTILDGYNKDIIGEFGSLDSLRWVLARRLFMYLAYLRRIEPLVRLLALISRNKCNAPMFLREKTLLSILMNFLILVVLDPIIIMSCIYTMVHILQDFCTRMKSESSTLDCINPRFLEVLLSLSN